MRELELLAPARTADIGIAAIDCGADAVYIAGPEFGARQAAGNPVEDIRRLCIHAHRFGARIFAALNTIIYDSEYGKACDMLLSLQDAGVDAGGDGEGSRRAYPGCRRSGGGYHCHRQRV